MVRSKRMRRNKRRAEPEKRVSVSLALGTFSDSFHFLIDLQRKRRQLNMVFF
jgi:hypothetical protein